MSDADTGTVRATVHFGRDLTGQLAIGNRIRQSMGQFDRDDPVTAAERAELTALFDALRKRIAAEVPVDQQGSALDRVDELADAVTDEKPELSTITAALTWFRKKLPELAAAVKDLILNPLVSRVVGATGEVAAAEFGEFLPGVAS